MNSKAENKRLGRIEIVKDHIKRLEKAGANQIRKRSVQWACEKWGVSERKSKEYVNIALGVDYVGD